MSITDARNTSSGQLFGDEERRRYKGRMARTKKFDQRIMVRFDDKTLAAVQKLLGDGEDRSDFIRAAVELAAAIRSLDVWEDLRSNLTATETVEDFCARAVRRAARLRKQALTEGDEPPALSTSE